MANENRTATYAALESQPLTPDRIEVIKAILTEVSSGQGEEDLDVRCPGLEGFERLGLEATQINVDIAQSLLCEAEEDISEDSHRDGYLDLFNSSEYQKLRQRFLYDATTAGNRTYAFQLAIWRASRDT